MSSKTYVIVFKGDVVDGHQTAAVQAQLARLLKLDQQKTKILFSGKQIILKRTPDKVEAVKYGKALKQIGAEVKIKVTLAETGVHSDPLAPKHDATDPAAAQPPTAAASMAESTIDSSTITLAPEVGDQFDPVPAAEAPGLDLSKYTVVENDGSFIVDPAEVVEVELDLSAYTVADDEGRDLYETEETIARNVEVPDFGLAEPGAVLETLQEDKEILNPNTKGMTLAVAGADLIEEDEKRPELPHRTPDTSGINLAPNFDT